MIYERIRQLIAYGIDKQLIEPEDEIYTRNLLLDLLKLDSYEETETGKKIETSKDLEQVLSDILDFGIERGIIRSDSVVFRDLFDTKIMNALVPKPSRVIGSFWEKYSMSPKEATDYYYEFSKNTDYIRTYRIEKDIKWAVPTEYGNMDMTINLSKPEKDPKMIALAGTIKSSSYPRCQLCMENEGYAGRINHPARENHRVIPIEINGKPWGFQYSPYVYYNEHCIVFNGRHVPMKIDRETFENMFAFIRLFPHYFVGSNADLPIVGGSILSHDHFQGGNYTFPMERAPIEKTVSFHGFEDIEGGIVKWPMSVIRLNGNDYKRIIELADRILCGWRGYTDEEAFIFARTEEEKHNTITPIARMREGRYELDLVLRNNITTREHPMGLYHPWEEYHHIKKENIGLIEVMGLAVLPARLKQELELLKDAVLRGADIRSMESIAAHGDWVEEIRTKYQEINEDNVELIFKREIGNVFKKVLECAGVYKRDEAGRKAFERFIAYVDSI